MTPLLLTPFHAARRGAALLAGLAFVAAPASAQVLIDDFDNGIGPGEFVFAGAEAGTLDLVDLGGGDQAARFSVDADDYGGFTGFGQPIEGGTVDISGFSQPVLEFDMVVEGSFTLEINFQNTGGGGEGEIREALRFELGPGNEGSFERYAIPLSAFRPTNAATFETDDVFQYVWTIVDAVGDGDSGTEETGIGLNNIQVVEGLSFDTMTEVVSFDSGDFADFFFFAGNEGITASATTDTPDGSANAFRGEVDGDEYGGFAGFGRTFVGAPLDITGNSTVNFYLRANGPATLEFNLQTNQSAGGNEGREVLTVSDTGGEWIPVSFPIEALIQSSATPPDFTQVYNFVTTVVLLPGDGDTSTNEFVFEIDAIGFGSLVDTAIGDLPETFSAAPVAFPNPTAGLATVTFDLATASDVSVDVVDLLGRRVATLADGPQAAGAVRLAVPTSTFAPGVYVVRVQTPAGVASTRLTVVR